MVKDKQIMEEGMSRIVKIIAGIVIVPLVVFGLYVILHGHLTPGGGFPGGAIMASGLIFFLVAFGKDVRRVFPPPFLSLTESLGLLIFIILCFLGLPFLLGSVQTTTSTFFFNFLAGKGGIFGKSVDFGTTVSNLNIGGTIPIMNMAVGLEVFSALSLIIFIMYTWDGKIEAKKKQKK